MLYGFIILTALLSMRYNYGNDYASYSDIFDRVKELGWDQLDQMTQWYEIGWLYLCKLFSPLGFQWLIAFHTIFIFSTFYYLINKYVSLGWKWMAVFYFLFNSGILIIYISMLRQSMAICFFLLAIDAAFDRKIIKMVLFCTFAYLVHHSAIIIVPFVLFSFLQSGWLTTFGATLGIVFMMLATFDDSIAAAILGRAFTAVDFIGEDFEKYAAAGSRGSGLGVVLELLVFAPALFDYGKYTRKEKIILLLFLFNMIVFPLQYVLLMFARIRYYFLVFGFLYIPIALKKCTRMEVKTFTIAVTIFITLWNYYQFFADKTFSRAYSVFHFCF